MRIKRAAVMLAGIVIGMGTFSLPVLANTGPEAECICDVKCTEESVNADCPVCTKDITLCQGTEAVKEKEAEETEPEEPLTPDGNMELIDDLGDHETSGKQFITVTTKSGNYFYIIIDRDDSGNENVHFLNQVDETDLLNLMDDEDIEAYQNAKEAAEETEELVVTTEPEELETEEPEAEPEQKKSKTPYVIGLVLFCGLLGAGGATFYVFRKKKDVRQDDYTDPDADYNENEDLDLPEEEEHVSFLDDDTEESGDFDEGE